MNLRAPPCLLASLLSLLFAAGCSSVAPQRAEPLALMPASAASAPSPARELKLLGTAVVSREADGVKQHFGGISGMDWDPRTNTWYLLSDDRSQVAPARFYVARIDIGASGFEAIDILDAVTLKQADGTRFPSLAEFNTKPAGEVPDPESLRIDPLNGDVVWSSEGDRRLGLNPFLKRNAKDGAFISEIPLPANLKVDREQEVGSRNNLTIEGVAFSANGSTLWASMEAPLYQDGPVPSLDAGSPARFTKLSRDGNVLAQYAYPIDPIPVAPTGGRKRADNGVSEILVVDDDTLLVIERSGYEVGESLFRFAIRIYEAKIGAATDVAGLHSLAGAGYVAMTKRLLVDINRLGLSHVDNLEAASWGPRLPNGNATLILAADDNFAAEQVNQFIAFEIIVH